VSTATAPARIEQRMKASAPVYPELEKLTLSFALERMANGWGPTPKSSVRSCPGTHRNARRPPR